MGKTDLNKVYIKTEISLRKLWRKITFWKAIAVFLVIFLLFLLWMNRWEYEAFGQIRVNKITGVIQKYHNSEKGPRWERIAKY